MGDLLVVSWSFPPLVMPRAIQVSRLLSALAETGWNSNVVCVDPRLLSRKSYRLDPELEKKLHPNIRVIRKSSPEAWLLLRLIWRLFPVLEQLPDPKIVWAPVALNTCEKTITSFATDGMVTFAQPWTDHLIGLALKKKYDLPWIAHFSDPWIDSPMMKRNGRIKQIVASMEAEVVSAADALVFVNRQTAEAVMKKYPSEWKEKVRVIPHGYDSDAIEKIEGMRAGIPAGEKKRIRLVYSGGFYGSRTPEVILKALSEWNRQAGGAGLFELHLAGQNTEKFARLADSLGLAETVTCHGNLAFRESMQISASADVLVVIDPVGDEVGFFLPSKLVEYLPFRRPILALTSENSATADLVRRTGGYITPAGDAPGVTAVLGRIYADWQAGRLQVGAQFESVLKEYDIRYVAKDFDQLLRNVCRGEASGEKSLS